MTTIISHSSGGCKSKFKASAELASGESLLPGLWSSDVTSDTCLPAWVMVLRDGAFGMSSGHEGSSFTSGIPALMQEAGGADLSLLTCDSDML